MSNAFDQFDQVKPKAAAAPPSPGGRSAPAEPTGNAFDRFDAPKPAPKPRSEFAVNVPQTAGNIAERAAASILGIPGDLVGLIERPVRTAIDLTFFEGVPTASKDYKPFLGSEHLSEMYHDVTGLKNESAYDPTGKSGAERVIESAGEFATIFAAPQNIVRASSKAPQIVKDVVDVVGGGMGPNTLASGRDAARLAGAVGTGAAAGAGAQIATEVAPEEWKPVAGMVGGLAGGIGAGVGGGALSSVGRSAARGAQYLAPALPWSDKSKMASRQLGETVADRQAAMAALSQPAEIIPGSRPSSAQMTGDAGLQSLEGSIARNDDQFKARLLEQRQQQVEAQLAALDNVQNSGSPSAVADYLNARMRQLEEQADAVYEQAAQSARKAADDLGPERSAGDVGNQARTAITDQLRGLNAEANALWKSIPKDVEILMKPVISGAARIYGALSPEAKLSLAPEEKAIAGLIGSYGETLPFERFSALRSEISKAMRKTQSGPEANSIAYARLSQLRGTIEDAVADSVATKVAEEADLVARGAMAEEDTLAAGFLQEAKKWYAEQTGGSAVASDAVSAGTNAPSIPRNLGAESQTGRGPVVAPGDQGLPANVRTPARVPGAAFNEGVADAQTGSGSGSVRPVSRPAAQPEGNAGRGAVEREADGSLRGLPRKAGDFQASASPDAQRVAKSYMEKAGLPYDPPNTYAKVNPKRAARIAAAYDEMKHDPQNPAVKRAYDAMITETLAQYDAMVADGVKIEFIPRGAEDPYAGNPRNMTEDVRNNKHMWVFSTKDGFGSDVTFDPVDNPLLRDSGYQISGQPATVNDIFRAVHDYFGHVKEGVGFRADGEENAWRSHSAMYSPEARKAMTTETRGQNSWVNYGPYGEKNRTARSEDTHYADQKIGILPDWAINEAAGDEIVTPRRDVAKRFEDTGGRSKIEADMNSALNEAVYEAMAKRLGTTVDELTKQYDLPSVTREAPKGAALEQKIIKLDDVRQEKKLQSFHRDMLSDIRQRVSEMSAATKAAQEKGVFGDIKVGNRLISKNAEGKALPPMKVEGLFLRKWRPDNKMMMATFERMGVKPTIVEFNGQQYVPMARVLQGVEGKGDWSRGDVYVDLVKGRQMGDLKSVGQTLFQSEREAYHPVTAYKHGQNANMAVVSIIDDALKMDPNPDHLAMMIDNDSALNHKAGLWLARNGEKTEGDSVGHTIQRLIEKEGMTQEQWAERNQRVAARTPTAPTFYSAVERAVTASKNAKANADQWMATIKNTPGVKAEEIEWLGLEPWLRERGGQVTKQEVEDYIRANSIEVEETKLKGIGLGDEEGELDIRIGQRETRDPDQDWIQEQADELAPQYIDEAMDELIPDYAKQYGISEEELRAWLGPPIMHPDLFDGETPLRSLTQEQIEIRDELQAEAKEKGEQAAYDAMERNYYEEPDEYGEVRVTLPNGDDVNYAIDYHSYGGGSIYNTTDGREVYEWSGRFDDADIESAIRDDLREQLDEFANTSDDATADGATKFNSYALHGGDDYTELLLKLPTDLGTPQAPRTISNNFTASHWDEPNVVAHVRFDTRTIDGKKTLFIQEIQSDWHQKGRERGYKNGNDDAKVEAAEKAYNDAYDDFQAEVQKRGGYSNPAYNEWALSAEGSAANRKLTELRDQRDAIRRENHLAVPEAPFKTTWPELVLKRMLRWGAENGFDQILWTPGDLQNGSLVTQRVPSITYAKNEDGSFNVMQSEYHAYPAHMTPEEVANTYGGKIAEQMSSEAGEPKGNSTVGQNARTIDTGDLRVGNHGMQTFYGKMVPSMLSKIVKKFDGKIERTPMDINGEKISAMALPITDKLRKMALEEGQPLFQKGKRGAIQFGADGSSLISMLKNADASTAPHELAHHFMRMYEGIAKSDKAPNAIREDWRTVNNWWSKNAAAVARDADMEGVTAADVKKVIAEGTTGDAAKDTAVNRGMQEQWARAFETYLREGTAPTAGLKRVFEQFKTWLQSIYRSITDLDVDLTPEMKGVFDRMLGAPKPNLMNEAQRQTFKQATAATRNIKDTYTGKSSGVVGPMLKRPGATYPYNVTDEAVATSLWAPGPKGAANIQQVLKAAGKSLEAREAIEAAALLSVRRSAMKDGVINPERLGVWRTKYADALRAVPELDKKLQSAAKASDAMAAVAQKRKDAIDTVQKTAIGKLLKLESDADVSSAIGTMLNGKNSVKSMRELVSAAQGNSDALAGLRRAVIEHMQNKLTTSKEAISPAMFLRYLGRNNAALSQVMSPEQINSLRALGQELRRFTKSTQAPGGNSATAERLAADRRNVPEKPSLLRKFLVDSGLGAGIAGALHLFNPSSPLLSASVGAASALGTYGVQAARMAGLRRAHEIVQEALLNPDLMKALMAKAPNKANTGSQITLAQRLAKIGAISALLAQE